MFSMAHLCWASGDIITKVGEFVQLPIAKEVKLNKRYNVDGTIDFKSDEIKDTDIIIRRLQGLVKSSQISNNANGFSVVEANTIIFQAAHLN